MRLDARNGDRFWDVWHVRECRKIEMCVFVDDQTCTWGEYPGRFEMMTHAAIYGDLPVIEHQAKSIRIIPARRLVLIDPIDDCDGAEDESEELKPQQPITTKEPA